MKTKYMAIIAFVVIFVVVTVLYIKYGKTSEGFRKCICSEDQGGRGCACQDTVDVNNAYVTGRATEFSVFPSKGWSTVSPGDLNWPLNSGCDWPDHSEKGKGWVRWDYTDFGSSPNDIVS